MLNDEEFLVNMETLMARRVDKLEVMKLLCLYSATHGGIVPKQMNQLVQAFCINYGYNEIVTMMNLQDSGLIKLRAEQHQVTQ